jgi:putative addiction module component (TIGR02574 family)
LEAIVGLAQLKGEIERLSTDEQLRLVEEIWDRLIADPDVVPVPDAHVAELERRLAEHDAAPDDVVAWDVLIAELRSR